MPLPLFSDLAGLDEFKKLPVEQQQQLSTDYWQNFAAENPEAQGYAQTQQDLANRTFETRARRADATPVERRFIDSELSDQSFELAFNEGVQRGQIDPATAQQEIESRRAQTAATRLQLEKTRSLADPQVAQQMAPAFQALRDTALKAGVFGSPTLDAKVSDILPGGEKDVVATNRGAYESLRKQLGDDFHLTSEEVDDVVKHQLDLHTEPVSRDALGTPYIKNEVLAAGPEATQQAINNSTLPWREKQRLSENLPEKIASFRSGTLETVRKTYPDLAKAIGIDAPPATPEEGQVQFQKLVQNLNDTRSEQFGGGFAAGQAASRELAAPVNRLLELGSPASRSGPIGEDPSAVRRQIEAVNNLSSELNQAKVQILGTDAAVFGQGAQSVAESVALGTLTGGVAPAFSASRIATMGPTARVLAGAANRAIAVSPVAGLGAAKSAASTYESALQAGKGEAEATKLAATSGAIEFGVTTLMSALHAGGLEDVGQEIAKASTKEALRSSARKAFDSFGGKAVLGIAAEQFEENLITALDTSLVQAKINPNLTVDDLGKQLRDTALVTMAVSGPAVAIGALAGEPVHDLPTPLLEVEANRTLALATADEPSPADIPNPGPEPSNAAQDGGSFATRETESQPAAGPTALAEPSATEASPLNENSSTNVELPPGPTGEIQIDNQNLTSEEPQIADLPTTPLPAEASVALPEVEQSSIPLEAPVETGGQANTDTGFDQSPQTSPESPSETLPEAPAPTPTVEEPIQAEAKAAEVDGSPTGMRNVIVDEQRVRRGLPPRFAPARQANAVAWDEAVKTIDRDPQAGANLIAARIQNPQPLSPLETAIFTHEQLTREQELDSALEALNKAPEGADRTDLLARLERAEGSLAEAYNTGQALGTLSGRSLQARQLVVNQDFSLGRMIAREQAVANEGRPLSAKQREEVVKLHEQIQTMQRRLSVFEAQEVDRLAQQVFEAAKKQNKKEASKSKPRGRRPLSFIEDQAQKARERIAARRAEGRLNSLPADEFLDHVIVGVSYLARGLNSLVEFTAELVKDFGERIRPFAPEIFSKSQEMYDTATSAPSRTKTREEVLSEIQPEEPVDGKVIYNLARAYINDGLTTFSEVMDAVLKDLRQFYPDLTLRQVHDAYSGYGRTVIPNQDTDRRRLREFRSLARLTSQLEDVLAGSAPLRTGLQRDATTEQVRALQKEVRDAMRRLNIRPVSEEKQLKTSLDAVKTRLRNEIEDIEASIRDQRPRPSGAPGVVYDEEAAALRERRDQLKKDYAAIFGKPQMTQEEQLAAAEKTLTQQIAAEEKMLAEGILSRRREPRMGAWSPRLAELQRQLDEKREVRRQLREAANPAQSPEKTAYDAALAAVKRSIERYEQILKDGKVEAKSPYPKFSPTNELLEMIRLRNELKEATAALRETGQTPRQSPRLVRRKGSALTDEEKTQRAKKTALRVLPDAIADLDRRIRNGDVSAKPAKADLLADDSDIKRLRESRDRLQKAFRQLQRDSIPQRDPELVRLERDKKMIQARINRLQRRINENDYAAPIKLPPAMDREKARLQLEELKVKDEFNRRLFEAQQARRDTSEKIWDAALDAAASIRTVRASIDVSAVLKQGGFLALGDPVLAAKLVPQMFLAGISEAEAHRFRKKIENDPLYLLSRKSKLFLSDIGAKPDLNSLEEEFRGRLVKKLPVLGPLIRFSERTYSDYLNALRFNTFRTMVLGLSDDGNVTADEAKVIANFVNIATGRGNLGKLETAASGLATVFFSPKFVASRFQLLGGVGSGFRYGKGATMRTRKAIAKRYARFLIGLGAAISLASLFQDDDEPPLELDPRSSDFLKVRFGNARVDLLSGLAQTTTFGSRMLTQKTKSPSGEIKNLTGDLKFGQPTILDTLGTFLRTKLAPLPALTLDLLSGQNVVGEPTRNASFIGQSLLPLSVKDIYDNMQKEGMAKGAALTLLSLFGVGVQSYQPRKSTQASDGRAKPILNSSSP